MPISKKRIEKLVREAVLRKISTLSEASTSPAGADDQQGEQGSSDSSASADDRAAQKSGKANIARVEDFMEKIKARSGESLDRMTDWSGDNRQRRLAILRSFLTDEEFGVGMEPDAVDSFLEKMFQEIQ